MSSNTQESFDEKLNNFPYVYTQISTLLKCALGKTVCKEAVTSISGLPFFWKQYLVARFAGSSVSTSADLQYP